MGVIGMFRRPHWIRRWGEGGRTDFKANLNVQPLGANDLKALPEGLRQTKRLKAWGNDKLTAGDQQTGQQGDWLYYDGRWYECVSCIAWDHTLLSHYRSEFCLVDGSVAKKNLEPPAESALEEGGGAGDGK